MNAHRMDQETVERLLGGPVVEPQDGPEPLVRLLTAIRAAPRPAELSGEGAAMQAFRVARAGSPLPAASHPARKAILAGLVSAKVAIAALAVAATGGVALAAATGTLPNPLHKPDAGTVPSTAPTGHPSSTGSAGPRTVPSTVASGRPSASASVSPATLGLCRAYRTDAGDNPGRALENPVFSDLIRSAGGREKVAAYCDGLLGGREGHGPPGTTAPGGPDGGSPGRQTGRPERSASTPGTPSTSAGDRRGRG